MKFLASARFGVNANLNPAVVELSTMTIWEIISLLPRRRAQLDSRGDQRELFCGLYAKQESRF